MILAAAQNTGILEELKQLFVFNTPKVTFSQAIVTIVLTLVMGFIISQIYNYSQKRSGGDIALSMTLMMVPSIVALIVMLIGDSIAGALSLGGAFSLIRYRSDPASPKDITYIFFSFASGIAAGVGYPIYAALFTAIFGIILIVLSSVGFGERKRDDMNLKVIVPEDMNFEGLLDDILEENTEHYRLRKIRTTDFGTLVELVYDVRLSKEASRKKLLDAIRCRNGNLNVSLTMKALDKE